jgi:hypothetical protein
MFRTPRRCTGSRRAFVIAPTFVFAGALTVAAPIAHATPNFPDRIASELGLGDPPPCSVCHSGPPGPGNASTPFASAMRSRGLAAYDEASLVTALTALRAARTDSDRDGIPDVDELLAGGDPNRGAATAEQGGDDVEPEYGCAAAPTFGDASRGLGTVVSSSAIVLAGAAVLRRRRRGSALRGGLPRA